MSDNYDSLGSTELFVYMREDELATEVFLSLQSTHSLATEETIFQPPAKLSAHFSTPRGPPRHFNPWSKIRFSTPPAVSTPGPKSGFHPPPPPRRFIFSTPKVSQNQVSTPIFFNPCFSTPKIPENRFFNPYFFNPWAKFLDFEISTPIFSTPEPNFWILKFQPLFFNPPPFQPLHFSTPRQTPRQMFDFSTPIFQPPANFGVSSVAHSLDQRESPLPD